MPLCFPIELVPAAMEQSVPRKGPGTLAIRKENQPLTPSLQTRLKANPRVLCLQSWPSFLAGEPRSCLFAVILVHRFLS